MKKVSKSKLIWLYLLPLIIIFAPLDIVLSSKAQRPPVQASLAPFSLIAKIRISIVKDSFITNLFNS